MLFISEIIYNKLSDSEKKDLDKWRKELKASGKEGQAIDKNYETEERVPEDILLVFVRKILEQFNRTGDPKDAIHNAVSKSDTPENIDHLLLKGPQATENLPEKFGRLNTYSSIRRFSKIDGAETMDEYQIPSEDEIESGQTINPIQLPNVLFSNKHGFLWTTDAEFIDPNLGIDELRCRLGIIAKEGTLILKVVYNNSLVDCFIPTIIEGRDFPAFQPTNDINAKSGYTRDLRDNSQSCPEWVHKGIPVPQLEENIGAVIRGNSRIPHGPIPDGYLDEKLR